MSLNAQSKVEGTLFMIPEDKRVTNGPIMKGEFQITGESGKINGSAWLKEKQDDPGSKYMSFALEISRELKFYGAIFPTNEKTAEKAPDYFGTLNLTKDKGGPTLRMAGWKRKGKQPPHTAFISVVIEPHQPKAGQGDGNAQQGRQHAARSDLPI